MVFSNGLRFKSYHRHLCSFFFLYNYLCVLKINKQQFIPMKKSKNIDLKAVNKANLKQAVTVMFKPDSTSIFMPKIFSVAFYTLLISEQISGFSGFGIIFCPCHF